MGEVPQEHLAALAARLRKLRVLADLSGKDLATVLRWPASKVSRVERGMTRPTVRDVEAWCQACDAATHLPKLLDMLGDAAKAHLLSGAVRAPNETRVVTTEPVTLNDGRRVRFALYMVPVNDEAEDTE